MIKIKLNNYECEINSYNRNTSIMEDNISSNANITVINGEAEELNALLGTDIESIEITIDEDKIYDLKNLNAEINTINEYLSGDSMIYNIGIIFK